MKTPTLPAPTHLALDAERLHELASGGYAMFSVVVTPELAGDLMARAAKNRKVSNALVERYADLMRRGEWARNGETIKLDRNGAVIDGQHRLLAVEVAGVAVPLDIIVGLEPESFETMDQGRIRKTSDYLYINDFQYTPLMAATINLLLVYERAGKPMSGNKKAAYRAKPSAKEAVAYAEGHEEELVAGCVVAGSTWFTRVPRSVIAFSYVTLARIDKEAADSFFSALGSGANLADDSPILKLRNRFIDWSTSRHTMLAEDAAAYIFKAWNAYRTQTPMRMLAWKPSQEDYPIPK